jgi:hypothetical protein
MTKTGPDDRESPVGADVDRAWRKLSREEPSATLDASILAAAHREAGARPQAAGAKQAMAERRRWWPLAAAATVAAIAIGVLQLTPPEDIGAPAQHATVSDMPTPPAKKTEAIPAAPAVQDNAAPPASSSDHRAPSEAPRVATMPRQASPATVPAPTRPAQEARPGVPASPTPEPFPAAPKRADAGANHSAASSAPPMARKEAPAPPAATGGVAAEQASPAAGAAAAVQDARKAAAAVPPPAPAPAAAPLAKMATSHAESAAGTARVKDRAPLQIPDWIALIRRLRDEGDTTHAAKELAAFRAAHADHEKLLPPDLRDWHPPEK